MHQVIAPSTTQFSVKGSLPPTSRRTLGRLHMLAASFHAERKADAP